MSNDKAGSEHYTRGDLLKAIQVSIARVGMATDRIMTDDLAPVELIPQKIKKI